MCNFGQIETALHCFFRMSPIFNLEKWPRIKDRFCTDTYTEHHPEQRNLKLHTAVSKYILGTNRF